MKVEVDDLLTPSQAAERRGVSRQAMSDLIKRSKIPTVWIAGLPFVKRQDVDAYEPDLGGRPRKVETKKKRTR